MCDNNGMHEHGGANCTCDINTSSEHGHTHEHGREHSHEHGDTAVAFSTELRVDGMTCSHCVSSVTQELSQLAGVKNVNVDLVAGGVSRVTVGSENTLDPEQVAAAIDEAGYELVDVTR
jgi:copper chaperone